MTALTEWAARHFSGDKWEMQEVIREIQGHCGAGPGCVDVVLEIGVHQGESLRVWREVFGPRCLIGVQDTEEFTLETADELNAERIIGRSQDEDTYNRVLRLLLPKPVDFLYIDGDHTYDAVLKDWQMYRPLVREGGVVVLHDAVIENNPTVDVWRLYREVRSGRRSKLIYGGPNNTGAAVFYL